MRFADVSVVLKAGGRCRPGSLQQDFYPVSVHRSVPGCAALTLMISQRRMEGALIHLTESTALRH